ncbi:MAG: carbon storage regulator CsrA [Gammaproteobacteria bacterium]|nr:carbon storage regulator CsrA [Gammaproteobacteria bacterium]
MLVLTRYINESIIVGNDWNNPANNVEITILSLRGEQVRLGIKAPKEITVHRQEIFVRIRNEKRQATSVTD